jgi:hypothetical protein
MKHARLPGRYKRVHVADFQVELIRAGRKEFPQKVTDLSKLFLPSLVEHELPGGFGA